MAINNKLTESKFKAIKILLNGGATYKEAAQYMQVGEATIYRVKSAETWEEYLQQTAARAAARALAVKEAKEKGGKPVAHPEKVDAPAQAQVVEHRQTVQITATHYMTEELREIKDILKIISNKMAVIVTDLYGTKEG